MTRAVARGGRLRGHQGCTLVGRVMRAKADELKRLQAETQKELDALMPSILDRAFKGEL